MTKWEPIEGAPKDGKVIGIGWFIDGVLDMSRYPAWWDEKFQQWRSPDARWDSPSHFTFDAPQNKKGF